MARNQVQFQKGLSDREFFSQYGTEAQCIEALKQWRWPDGFVCPRCVHTRGYFIETRKLYQCAQCRAQTSLTADTIFHSTKLPLTVWFLAMHHLTQSKNGISALELSRRLDVNYDTAWKLKHKLMQVMKERDDEHCQLSERVEMDDAYLGGAQPGKSGRGAAGKTPFIAAVQTDAEGRPQKMRLRVVEGFTWAEVVRFSQKSLLGGTEVHTDGLACFTGVLLADCVHRPQVCGGGRQAAQNPDFHWVNTILANVKNAITGTYRHIDAKHAPRYLAEFQYRFNRRFNLAQLLPRLARVAVRTPPMPYRLLKLAESHG